MSKQTKFSVTMKLNSKDFEKWLEQAPKKMLKAVQDTSVHFLDQAENWIGRKASTEMPSGGGSYSTSFRREGPISTRIKKNYWRIRNSLINFHQWAQGIEYGTRDYHISEQFNMSRRGRGQTFKKNWMPIEFKWSGEYALKPFRRGMGRGLGTQEQGLYFPDGYKYFQRARNFVRRQIKRKMIQNIKRRLRI